MLKKQRETLACWQWVQSSWQSVGTETVTCCLLSFIHGEQRSEAPVDSAAGAADGRKMVGKSWWRWGGGGRCCLHSPPLTAANGRKVGP